MSTQELTPDKLAATQRGLQALFTKLYKAVEIGPWANLFQTVGSDGPGEDYPAFGAAPSLSVFSGTRQYTGIRTDGMYVTNVEYDAGLEIRRVDIERDRLGVYNGRIEEMAQKARTYVVRLLAHILANGTSTSVARCWDGAALFSASHGKEKGKGQSNIITGSGVDTIAKIQLDIEQVVARLGSWLDDKGDVVGPVDAPLTILYPKAHYSLAMHLRTIADNRTGDGTPNQSRLIANLIGVPELTGNTWIAAIGGQGVRPFGYQVEKDATPETTYDFDRKVMKMAVELRAAAFCGDWMKIVQVANT